MMKIGAAEWMIVLCILGFLALLVIGGVVAIVLAVVRPAGNRTSTPPAEPANAFEVLQMRYARGEITRDEYLRMQDDLNARKE
jgi:putative membrane protein